jgi:hypothetical protein
LISPPRSTARAAHSPLLTPITYVFPREKNLSRRQQFGLRFSHVCSEGDDRRHRSARGGEALSQFDDAEVRRKIEIALKNTFERGFGLNHSLYHGDLGNLELLLESGMRLGDPQRLGRAKQIATTILESSKENGWICGIPPGVEKPGLMDGLARNSKPKLSYYGKAVMAKR